MMQQLNIRIEKRLVDSIDGLIEREKEFSTRSEFVRYAVRRQLAEESLEDFTKILRNRGVTPKNAGLLTRKEREKIFNEFKKQKKFS